MVNNNNDGSLITRLRANAVYRSVPMHDERKRPNSFSIVFESRNFLVSGVQFQMSLEDLRPVGDQILFCDSFVLGGMKKGGVLMSNDEILEFIMSDFSKCFFNGKKSHKMNEERQMRSHVGLELEHSETKEIFKMFGPVPAFAAVVPPSS